MASDSDDDRRGGGDDRETAEDDRSAMAQAYSWAGRIVTVSLEMALPGAVGYWLNQQYGWPVWVAIVGVIGGSVLGFWHLLRMTGADDAADKSPFRKR